MFRILSRLYFGPFLRRDLVFGEISVTGCATLILTKRKSANMYVGSVWKRAQPRTMQKKEYYLDLAVAKERFCSATEKGDETCLL